MIALGSFLLAKQRRKKISISNQTKAGSTKSLTPTDGQVVQPVWTGLASEIRKLAGSQAPRPGHATLAGCCSPLDYSPVPAAGWLDAPAAAFASRRAHSY